MKPITAAVCVLLWSFGYAHSANHVQFGVSGADTIFVGQAVQPEVEITHPLPGEGARLSNSWILDAIATDNPPVIDCGSTINYAAPPNLMIKHDIIALDPDTGDDLSYFLVFAEPLPHNMPQIDPSTGVFTFEPVVQDLGSLFTFCVGATDGVYDVWCEFRVEMISQECCVGDPNIDGSTDVADAVMIIDYIFKGGRKPDIMNFADVNADCTVNIADAVYIVQFVFQGGPEPLLGCVYQ